MLLKVLFWLIVAAVLTVSSAQEEVLLGEVKSEDSSAASDLQLKNDRRGRFFFGSGITGINRLTFLDKSSERMKSLKTRVDTLLMKITEFEKLRAKLSDAEKLLKLIEKLSNICPPNTNSLRVKNYCYEHVTTHWMDYDSAHAYCKARGGYLARPDLEDDHYLETLRETFPSLGDHSCLVGITDILHEGHFTFLDGTHISPNRFYGGIFPTNSDKDCVSLIYGGRYCITDTQCKRLHEVLCEYKFKSLLKDSSMDTDPIY